MITHTIRVFVANSWTALSGKTEVMPMIKSNRAIETELHSAPRWLIALLFAAGIVFIVVSSAQPGTFGHMRVMLLALFLYMAAGAAWLLEESRPRLSRAITLVSVVTVVGLGFAWLNEPGFLILMPVPVVLAAVLLGLPAVTIAALGESALLILAVYVVPNADPTSMILALIAVWVTAGLMVAVYTPMYNITRWSWEHFQQAQNLLEETRGQKAELEQIRDDLALANRELVLLTERLAAMRLIAEEAQKAKAAFVAKISHEFRTPLNMIIGLIDTLTETPQLYGQGLSPLLFRDLEVVHRNSEHLASLINDVLDLSQAEAGRLTLHREWVDLIADINNALAVVNPLLEKKHLSLQLSIADNLPRVYCDQTRIRQVVLNLMSNAARYTEKGGISVQVSQKGQDVIVSVTDTGPGIAPDDAQRIFEPFYRGSGGFWREQGGSGLGLSISKQFIERHGGRIWFESTVGVGSTFAFSLPISPLSPTAGPERWVSEDWVFLERADWPSLPKLPYKRRVLICDDAGVLYPQFSRYSDEIEFVDTRNLAETSQEARRCPAHAVIVNTTSPRQLEALLAKARSEIPDTPIIGCAVPPRIDYALDAGAIAHLIKPIRQADLEKVLRAIDSPVKRVLVVDDDPDVLELFVRMLSIYDKTLQIATAASGPDALVELRNRPPDLVFLDIVMPAMDGWQVLEHKGRDKVAKDIPVVIISAEDSAEQIGTSEVLLASMGKGLSTNQILCCSLQLSKLLLEPEQEPGPGPE
jgi:signal transduction histidine kinase/CheY-like chemotaxis protein